MLRNKTCLIQKSSFVCLTLSCIMLKNKQTYFKNYAVFTTQDYKNMSCYFTTISMKTKTSM